jgi:hypothetical protein
MDKQEFRKWLLGEYRPPAKVANDGQGGYLIPHFITADKAGNLAAFYRWIGRLLRSPRIYDMGTYQFDIYSALLGKVKKAKGNG